MLESFLSAGMQIFKHIFPDKSDQAKIELALQQLNSKIQMGQIEVNKAEAQHRSIFVAGWRPFIGWVCGFAIFYDFIIRPILSLFHLNPIAVDTSSLYPLLLGMLGLGGMRTIEKIKGISK